MEITFDELLAHIEKTRDIYEAAYKLLPEYLETQKFKPGYPEKMQAAEHVYPVDMDSETIYFEGEEHWAYGGYEKHYIEMPLAYLYNTEARMELLQTCIDAQEASVAKQAQAVADAPALSHEHRKNLYEELKKEFE